ncbi:MAG TPA: helix-turn-helix transcriptional regulator [Pirellulales bacterium]|nr:helix-turn-helix transcriptional regulator [Pirellulales bacterium]
MTPAKAAKQRGLHDQIRAHIKAHIVASGATQAEIAKACGIGRPSLNKFLAGKVLGPEAIDRIADHLGLVVVKRRSGGKR